MAGRDFFPSSTSVKPGHTRLRKISGATAMLTALVVLSSAAADAQEEEKGILQQPFVRQADGLLRYELKPDFEGKYKYASFVTNRWGMRDKDYALEPARETFRIALVGSSFTMASGVAHEATAETIVENSLNRDGGRLRAKRFEILNFSVGGYGLLNNVAVMEEKVLPCHPSAVLLVLHSVEEGGIRSQLVAMARDGSGDAHPYVRDVLRRAGVKQGMLEPEIRRRLADVSSQVMSWGLGRISVSDGRMVSLSFV